MGADEGEFFIFARGVDGSAKGGMQFREVGERLPFEGARRDPGRMFENRSQVKGELLQIKRIELVPALASRFRTK